MIDDMTAMIMWLIAMFYAVIFATYDYMHGHDGTNRDNNSFDKIIDTIK